MNIYEVDKLISDKFKFEADYISYKGHSDDAYYFTYISKHSGGLWDVKVLKKDYSVWIKLDDENIKNSQWLPDGLLFNEKQTKIANKKRSK